MVIYFAEHHRCSGHGGVNLAATSTENKSSITAVFIRNVSKKKVIINLLYGCCRHGDRHLLEVKTGDLTNVPNIMELLLLGRRCSARIINAIYLLRRRRKRTIQELVVSICHQWLQIVLIVVWQTCELLAVINSKFTCVGHPSIH